MDVFWRLRRELIRTPPWKTYLSNLSSRARLGSHLSASARDNARGILGNGVQHDGVLCIYICFPKYEIVFTSVLFYNFFVNLMLFVGGYMSVKETVTERGREGEK